MFTIVGQTTTSSSADAAIVGNAFRDPVDPDEAFIEKGNLYVDDNVANSEETEMVGMPGDGVFTELLDEPPLWPDGLDPMRGEKAAEAAFDHVGARPAARTDHDERIVQHVVEGSGEWIDSQSEVDGYPDLEENYRELEVPDTNLRNWLRQHARRVEA